MHVRRRMLGRTASLAIGLAASVWLATAPTTWAGTIQNPTLPGKPGYISADSQSIKDSDYVRIDNGYNTNPAPSDLYTFDVEPLVITYTNGQQLTGKVEGFDQQSTNYLNGYNLVLDNDLANYVTALGGNLQFVEANTNTATLTGPNGTYTVRNFADIVDESGAIFEKPTPDISYNGDEIITTYHVQTSAPPYGHVSLDQSAYTVGDQVNVYTQAFIDTYHTNWHKEAVEVTGPGGFDKWLIGSGSSWDQMADVNGGGPSSYDGGPPSWVEIDYSYSLSTAGLQPGTYTVRFYVADEVGRVDQTPATATFTLEPNNSGDLTLSADNTSPTVGQPVTLTASFNQTVASNKAIYIHDLSGAGTLQPGNANQRNGALGASEFVTTAVSQTAQTVTYQAALQLPDGSYVHSGTVQVTWSASGNPPGGGGNPPGGGQQQCPTPPTPPAPNPPYDTNIQWTSDGRGDETLTWTYVYYTVEPVTDSNGCVTGYQQLPHSVPESQYYPANVGGGQISGLSYDPGTPNYMWLPVPAWRWNMYQGADSFWGPTDWKHGWTGLENGGPDASQVSSNVWVNGQMFHTYGPPIGSQTPTVWVRAGAGFGFRYIWTGSPHAVPTGGTVTYTMTNPDGASLTWTKPLIINTETLNNPGTQPSGTQAPGVASVVFSQWTDLPKDLLKNGKPELVAWSLSHNWQDAYNNGAHVSLSITLNTPAGPVTVQAPNVACTFSFPAYWFTRLASDSLLERIKHTTPSSLSLDGQLIIPDPSLGVKPGIYGQY